MSKAKETTARNPSVGADGGQPSKTYTPTITETEAKCKENFAEPWYISCKLQWTREPDCLNPAFCGERREESSPRDGARRCDDKIGTPQNIVATVAHRRGWKGREVSVPFDHPQNNTRRRPSGIGGTPNRPWVWKYFSSLRDPVLLFSCHDLLSLQILSAVPCINGWKKQETIREGRWQIRGDECA